MKKIVILRCLKSNDVCTGASCFRALHTKSGAFNQYGNENIELLAFTSCNGCDDCYLKNQEGLKEKITMIISLKPDAVHIGACCIITDKQGKHLCSKIFDICHELKAAGIKIVEGTH